MRISFYAASEHLNRAVVGPAQDTIVVASLLVLASLNRLRENGEALVEKEAPPRPPPPLSFSYPLTHLSLVCVTHTPALPHLSPSHTLSHTCAILNRTAV